MSINWRERDEKEQKRIRERQKDMNSLHRRMSLSAPSQRTTLASLFSNPFSASGGGRVGDSAGTGAVSGSGEQISRLQTQLQKAKLEKSQLQSQLQSQLIGLGRGSGVDSQQMIERKLEELSQQIGAVAEALDQVQQNTAFNHEQNLDRLDGLRVQIRNESERLMRTMKTVRETSNCDLRDPTTYIYCIELIYKLLFKIFVFLCQLVFVVGKSFKRFLSYMPFPFSILVFIAYIFEITLILILFDRTMYVGTLGLSHQEFIPHNSLFERYSGAPQMIAPRMVLYEGFARSIITVSNGLFFVLSSAYETLLGDVIGMVGGVGRTVSRDAITGTKYNVAGAVRNHVVNPLTEKVKEKVVEKVEELANEQLSKMGSLPGQIGDLAVRGAHNAASLAKGVAEGIALRAERLSKIDPENVKDATSAMAEKLAEKTEKLYYNAQRFKSRIFGGSIVEHRNTNKGNSRMKHRKTFKKYQIPSFTILTKKEQNEFDKTLTGKRLKELEKILNDTDFSKIQPNPEMFHIIRFVLNIAEKLFPVFVVEFDKSIKVAKKMKDIPFSDINIVKQIKDVIDIR